MKHIEQNKDRVECGDLLKDNDELSEDAVNNNKVSDQEADSSESRVG